jgi:hypothetical protein
MIFEMHFFTHDSSSARGSTNNFFKCFASFQKKSALFCFCQKKLHLGPQVTSNINHKKSVCRKSSVSSFVLVSLKDGNLTLHCCHVYYCFYSKCVFLCPFSAYNVGSIRSRSGTLPTEGQI